MAQCPFASHTAPTSVKGQTPASPVTSVVSSTSGKAHCSSVRLATQETTGPRGAALLPARSCERVRGWSRCASVRFAPAALMLLSLSSKKRLHTYLRIKGLPLFLSLSLAWRASKSTFFLDTETRTERLRVSLLNRGCVTPRLPSKEGGELALPSLSSIREVIDSTRRTVARRTVASGAVT